MTTDTDPQTFTSTVIGWLTAHPGWHSPVDVAEGVGSDTTKTAHTLHYLTRRGRIRRKRSETIRNGRGASTYAV